MSSCAFYSVSSPQLVRAIESRIRVPWHWDRDDDVHPRTDEEQQQMRGGCHCIVQMQVAERSDESSVDDPVDGPSSAPLQSEEEEEAQPSSKRHKSRHTRTQGDDGHDDQRGASVYSSPSLSHPSPASSDSSRIHDLDDESPDHVLSAFLTPSFLSRATVLLPHSAKFHTLFYHYYDIFIVRQQSEHVWRTEGCPVFLHRFELHLFNERLAHIKTMDGPQTDSDQTATNCPPLPYDTPLAPDLEWSLLRAWRSSPFDFRLDDVPNRFPIFLANYSTRTHTRPAIGSSDADEIKESALPDSTEGDLLVMPLRTVHAVLDAAPEAQVVRLKMFLGFYAHHPWPEDESGFVVGHGPGRQDARTFESHAASTRSHDAVVDEWSRMRLDEAAWKLWRGADAMRDATIEDGRHVVDVPVGARVPLTDKTSAEVAHQSAQCNQLLSDLRQYSCSLIRGIFPSSLRTSSGTLAYLHRLLRLPSHFSLTSTRPFHALAFHDARLRRTFGLHATHLRRDVNAHETTHIQASHGNTAYGAYCAPVVEAALFLQPLVRTIWHEWNLGRDKPNQEDATQQEPTNNGGDDVPSPTMNSPVRLYTIEVGYQAPLPPSNTASHAAAPVHSAAAERSHHKGKRRNHE